MTDSDRQINRQVELERERIELATEEYLESELEARRKERDVYWSRNGDLKEKLIESLKERDQALARLEKLREALKLYEAAAALADDDKAAGGSDE